MTIRNIFDTGHALLSFRDNGYSFSTAIGEVVDNSIEAGASDIDINLISGSRGKKSYVNAVTFSDDGCGMDNDTLHSYMVIGASTRYGSTSGIGKYGVGAKLAALNYARRIRVWSRTDSSTPFRYVEFDLDEALTLEQSGRSNEVGVHAPVERQIDEYYSNCITNQTKTFVVWEKVDRLHDGRVAKDIQQLKGMLKTELGRIFRNFIFNGVRLTLDGDVFKHFDPAMLLEKSFQDDVLTKVYHPESQTIKHFPAIKIADRVTLLKMGESEATLTVTLYPKEVTRKRGMGGDKLAKGLKVPNNEGRISFVRMGREISYVNVPKIFSRSVCSQDRFIGITVEFPAEFDDLMGVRSVKRGVEPFDSLRTEIRDKLKVYLDTASALLIKGWKEAESGTEMDFSEIEEAVKRANQMMPNTQAALNDVKHSDLKNALTSLAEEIGLEQDDITTYVERKSGIPYVLEVVDGDSDTFVEFTQSQGQEIIRLSKNHPMYREVWLPLTLASKQTEATINQLNPIKLAQHAINSLNLMLVSMAKSKSTIGEHDFAAYNDKFGFNLSRLISTAKPKGE